MPYLRFTKAIIHYFMSKHKSISRREGSPMHTVVDDKLLERLKFINKGDAHQIYGKPIPSGWLTDKIKDSEAYQMFYKYPTGLIPPKISRGRAGKEEKLQLRDESDESVSEGQFENRPVGRKKRTPRAVVIKEPSIITKKSAQESSKKLKGIAMLSEAAQLELDIKKAIKMRRHDNRFQHISGDSSKGTGLKPGIPDESARKFVISDEGTGAKLETDDEETDDVDKAKKDDDVDDEMKDDDNDDKSFDITHTIDDSTDSDV
ncbi:hypothetical protein Tco_1066764 [Tanacetum coccineum]|uniref:Uncharacterized protein n=1 Tax=Tanacetum coccineum TaxID=301880 RepID=A0ABQ5HCP2_9ASTR